jgi:NADPH:quinone reductase-like Zn-dependent oxidoreductase
MVMSVFVHQRLTSFICKEHSSHLERLTELIEAGSVTPTIDRCYSLDQVPAAMRYLVAGKARGKVVITM